MTKFKVGDIVEVLKVSEDAKLEGPGWADEMDSFIGKKHKIISIDRDGDVILRYAGDEYYFYPGWLKLVAACKDNVNKFWVVLHEDNVSGEFDSLRKAEAHAKALSEASGVDSYVLQVVSGYKVKSKATKMKIV